MIKVILRIWEPRQVGHIFPGESSGSTASVVTSDKYSDFQAAATGWSRNGIREKG